MKRHITLTLWIILILLSSFSHGVTEESAQDLIKKADTLAAEKKYNEAFPYYEAALKKEPHNINIYNQYGWFLYQSGNTPKAIAITERGYNLKKTNRYLVVNLALYHGSIGQFDLGERYYNELAAIKLKKGVHGIAKMGKKWVKQRIRRRKYNGGIKK